MTRFIERLPLTPVATTSESRLVKSAALMTFRFLRSAIDAAKTVPGIVSEAASDVREAWEESNTSPKP